MFKRYIDDVTWKQQDARIADLEKGNNTLNKIVKGLLNVEKAELLANWYNKRSKGKASFKVAENTFFISHEAWIEGVPFDDFEKRVEKLKLSEYEKCNKKGKCK